MFHAHAHVRIARKCACTHRLDPLHWNIRNAKHNPLITHRKQAFQPCATSEQPEPPEPVSSAQPSREILIERNGCGCGRTDGRGAREARKTADPQAGAGDDEARRTARLAASWRAGIFNLTR